LVDHVIRALLRAVGAGRVGSGGENPGESYFVLFGEEAFWLVRFDVADEEVDVERAVECELFDSDASIPCEYTAIFDGFGWVGYFVGGAVLDDDLLGFVVDCDLRTLWRLYH